MPQYPSSQTQFKDHLKKSEAVSEFAKSKTIAEQRRFLPVYQVREELLQVSGWVELSVELVEFRFLQPAELCCRVVGVPRAGGAAAGGWVGDSGVQTASQMFGRD